MWEGSKIKIDVPVFVVDILFVIIVSSDELRTFFTTIAEYACFSPQSVFDSGRTVFSGMYGELLLDAGVFPVVTVIGEL